MEQQRKAKENENLVLCGQWIQMVSISCSRGGCMQRAAIVPVCALMPMRCRPPTAPGTGVVASCILLQFVVVASPGHADC